MLTRIRSQLPLWRRALRRRRRTLALLTAALLVAALLPSLLPVLLPSAAATATVVVASAELPIGTELELADLETVRVAGDLSPPRAATDPEHLTGRRTVTVVPAGAPVLPGMLEGEGIDVVPAGSSLMAIGAPAVLAAHLLPGTTIEILSATSGAVSTRHTRAQVVEVAVRDDGAMAGLAGPAAGEVVVLVTIDAAGARDLAHAMHEGWLAITIIG